VTPDDVDKNIEEDALVDDAPSPSKRPPKKTKKATAKPLSPILEETEKPVKKATEAAKKQPTTAKPEKIADLEPPPPARPDDSQLPLPPAVPVASSPRLFGNQFKEAIFQDKAGGNSELGFFDGAQENFPGLEAFGLSWEPKKEKVAASSRSKRAATIVLKNPFYYRDDRRKRASRQGARPVRPVQQQGSRRSGQGPSGFWDNTEFDSDFFNGGSPGPATSSPAGFSSSYEEFSASPTPIQKYGVQQQLLQPQYQKPARLSYSPPPQVQQYNSYGYSTKYRCVEQQR
jgi:hypothetical protein